MSSGGSVDVGCVLLAGGLSRRMGGRDKGLIEIAGKPMVAWVLDTVMPQVSTVVINANRNHEAYAEFGVKVVPDSLPGHLGPLAGLLTGLRSLTEPIVFMCPCDSPMLPADMVPRLQRDLLAKQADIAVAHDGQRLQPVFCLVRRSVAESLADYLASGERKIDRWYAVEKMITTDFSDSPDAFNNINTEQDRLSMEAKLGR